MGLQDVVAGADGVEVVLARAMDGRLRSMEASRKEFGRSGPHFPAVHLDCFRFRHQ